MARILTITLNPALDLSVETPPLTLGEVNRTGHTLIEPAGKGINVARVLARLGTRSPWQDCWVTLIPGPLNVCLRRKASRTVLSVFLAETESISRLLRPADG